MIASATAASVLLMRGQSPSSHEAYKFFTPPQMKKPQNNPGGAFADSSSWRSHHAPTWDNNQSVPFNHAFPIEVGGCIHTYLIHNTNLLFTH